MGQVVNQTGEGGGSGLDIEAATTFVAYYGAITGCHTGASGTRWCEYAVTNYCSNTGSPDLDMTNQNINDAQFYPNWWVGAICWSGNVDSFGQGHAPWFCFYGGAEGESQPLPPQVCTYNP
jgi:hypothetical protein